MTRRLLVLSGLALAAGYIWLIVGPRWDVISSKYSPDGDWIAHHMRAKADVGEAPAGGDHIVLIASYWPFGQYYGEVVFAGYCAGNARHGWLATDRLRVECQAQQVVKQITEHQGVTVEYSIAAP